MKTVSISGSPRANVGKTDATALRNAKSVPCVLYGGTEQIHFSVKEADVRHLIYTPDVQTVNLSIGEKNFHAIVQETQFHPVKDNLLHIDFLEIVAGKPVVLSLPIKTSGTSPGVRNGGKLVKKLKTLRAKGLVENMPDAVTIAIDKMEIGDSIRVENINLPGITFLNAMIVTVISVDVTRASVETPAAAAAAPAAAAAAKAPAAGAKAPAASAKK
jgi:large subunit ribosomal protein L25